MSMNCTKLLFRWRARKVAGIIVKMTVTDRRLRKILFKSTAFEEHRGLLSKNGTYVPELQLSKSQHLEQEKGVTLGSLPW